MSHPFLDTSLDINWPALTPEHIVPDMSVALERAEAELKVLTQQDRAVLTYDSTFGALEELTNSLGQPWGKVSTLLSVNNSPELRKAHGEMLPKMTDFYTSIPLNADLWAVLKAFSESEAAKQATGARKRYMEETLEDFREAGADLPEEQKQQLQKLQGELARLTKDFSENVLDATNAYELVIEDEARLAGLPESAKAQALHAAEEKQYGTAESPKWLFTLHAPSLVPVLTYAEDASLREEMWRAYNQLGRKEPHDNRTILQEIIRLRAEKAKLLGAKNFADLVLKRRMAKSGEQALDFVDKLCEKTKARFHEQNREVEQFKASKLGIEVAPMDPWEVGYWSEKLRRERFDFDEEELRPYFSVDRVINGMFELTGKLFGFEVVPAEGHVWHKEVKLYELRDKDGTVLGKFATDWHPRSSKRGGAWMADLRTGQRDGGIHEPHLGYIAGNMTPPGKGKPALLTHREVETIFHEFGHLIHHLLGAVEVRSLNGVHVSWDFVELPSQILENWCWERESLDLFARHHETGEPIPDTLLEKLQRTRTYMGAVSQMRQLYFAKMDLELHLNPDDFLGDDFDAKVDAMMAPYLAKRSMPVANNLPSFSHLFSDSTGYAAGYYSYKWAEVLDADAFSRFMESGLLNEAIGHEFREKILSKGNSAPPEVLYHDFMGREPSQQPLLERIGVA